VWAEVVALAGAQHGVVALYQLVALGLDPRAIQARAAVASLHRVHHAVYSLVPPKLLSREGRFMAAVLACGPDAALSHRSAAALLELAPTSRANVDVTIPGSSHRRHAGSRRDQRLVAAGWRVIRITWEQLEQEPRRVLAAIARVLNL
jgi:hypothetical protein